ncbi:MAG: hypothetical protein IPP60_14245 [Sphingobacteriales bacterium]|nr:hypothetical protein [Sphingobacteriales bacterium]
MGKRINAFTDDALGTMDATELAAAISTKNIRKRSNRSSHCPCGKSKSNLRCHRY